MEYIPIRIVLRIQKPVVILTRVQIVFMAFAIWHTSIINLEQE